MHKCFRCGKEFDGKFCPECGRRWVNQNACLKCGTLYAEGAKFCTECGSAKVVCAKCGALMKDTDLFCAECGTKVNADIPVANADIPVTVSDADNSATKGKVFSIFGFVGTMLILASALMGLIFTFVIGISMSVDGKITETSMLYDYFGKGYDNLDVLGEAIRQMFDFYKIGEVREFAIYFPVVLGTAVSALGMIGVVTLSVVTGVMAYKKYYKKKNVNIVAPAVGTYLTFAATATAILSINMVTSDGDGIVFSKPTVAGLVSGGILLGLGVAALIVSNYKSFKGFKALSSAICTLVASVFVAVALALVAGPAFSVMSRVDEVDGGLALLRGMSSMLLFIESDTAITKITLFATIGTLAGMALLVLSAVVLAKNISGINRGKCKSRLVLCIIITVLAVVYLVFTVLTKNAMIDGVSEVSSSAVSVDEQYKFTAPIEIVVMSALAVISAICGTVMGKTSKPVKAGEEVEA